MYCTACSFQSAPVLLGRLLSFYESLEPTVGHTLHVERHRIGMTHVTDSRILHDLRVDAVAMRTRFVYNPRKHHRLACLELGQSCKRYAHFHGEIVADAFTVIQRAIFPPDRSRLLGHPTVDLELFLRDRQHKAIDILSHVEPSFAVWVIGSRPVAFPQGC